MIDSLLAGFPVVIELNVYWGEMDAFQHVNNVVYFRYFENARLEYFRRLEWPEYQKQTGIGPILASTSARFRKPLSFPDTILVATRVPSLATDRFPMEYRVVSRKLAALATEGEGLIVSYDYSRSVKVPIPDELCRRIEALEGR